MAEVTAARNNALPYPMYGLAWIIAYPFQDADGDLVTGATTPDAEVSRNLDTFADCTNESTEVATASGIYYLTLTAAEMTADLVIVQAKSASAGMKTTVATLYPRKLVPFKASATSQAGAAGTITFDAGASAIDDFYNGMVIVATIDTLVETRIITDYVGSTKIASVTPNWSTTPDADDTFIVYLTPEMSHMVQADVRAVAGAAPSIATQTSVDTIAGYLDTEVAAIKAKTDNLPSDPADASDITTAFGTVNATLATIAALVDTEVAAIKTKTDQLTFGTANRVDAQVFGLEAGAKSEVNAEVLDVLTVDTFAQPGQENPAAATTLGKMLAYLYKGWRNKHTSTSSEYALFADDGTTKDQEATLSDDATTFTRGEVQTGA